MNRKQNTKNVYPPPIKLVGCSDAIRVAHEQVKRVVRFARKTKTPPVVLIRGEPGTGKDITARLLHEQVGPARDFIVQNMTTIGKDLFESEMFGHEKGAYTGANETKPGLIELAKNGTLFLDEIGELPKGLQPKLLRVLEYYDYRSVGGRQKTSEVKLYLFATNKNLEQQIELDQFRQDLYDRISVLCIHLPPLREHPEDIPELIEHFCRLEFPDKPTLRFSDEAMDFLRRYPWPGNVREVGNMVKSCLAFELPEPIQVDDLKIAYTRISQKDESATQQEVIDQMLHAINPNSIKVKALREAVEERYFVALVKEHGLNREVLQNITGLSRSQLDRKIDKFHLDKID